MTEQIQTTDTPADAVQSTGSKAAWTLAAVPLAFAALAKKAFGQAQQPTVTEVLNFALTLEFLEAEFYITGLNRSGLIPASDRAIFTTIRDHEIAHVQFLREALGANAVARPNFDFTAGGAFPDVFSNYTTFVTLATAFEDTGVRAYKGAAPALMGNDAVLTAALKIHSVEARHAAEVRRLPQSYATQGWIPFNQPGAPAAVQPVYQGMAETIKYGINVVAVSSQFGVDTEDVTEAFDEPLTIQQVLQIVGPFIVS